MRKSMDRRAFVGVGATALATIGAMGVGGCTSTQVESGAGSSGDEATAEESTTLISEMTEEELQAAWEQEEAYGQTITVNYEGGLCGAGLPAALYLGYYEEEGLDVEIVNTGVTAEIIGTGKATMGLDHIAALLVPATNGVGMTLVNPVQTGCQSLYVLADSAYESTADLVGKTINCPNGIGTADQNIVYRFLMADGIDIDAVDYKVVTTDAVLTALQNDEIQASLLSDVFAYEMLQNGTLRTIRSLTYDEDFADDPCCTVALNTEFLEKNPVTSYKLVKAFARANAWLGDEVEEAAQIAIDESWASGDAEEAAYFLTAWDFDVTNDRCEDALTRIAADYKECGIFDDNDEDVESIIDRVWYPVLDR